MGEPDVHCYGWLIQLYADGGLLKEAFGAPVVAQVFFLLIMAGGLVYYKITLYIGRFFLTRKFTNGKPWLLMFVICIGCYFLGGFISPFTAIFLFWPVLYDVFEEVGYKKGMRCLVSC